MSASVNAGGLAARSDSKDKIDVAKQEAFIEYAVPLDMEVEWDEKTFTGIRRRVFNESRTVTLDKTPGSNLTLPPHTKTDVQLVWNEGALYQLWTVQVNGEKYLEKNYISQLHFIATIALGSSCSLDEDNVPTDVLCWKFNWDGKVVDCVSTFPNSNWANSCNPNPHVWVRAGCETQVGSGPSLSESRVVYVERSFLVRIPVVDLDVKQLNVDQHMVLCLYRCLESESNSHISVEQAWGLEPTCIGNIVMASTQPIAPPVPYGHLVLKKTVINK